MTQMTREERDALVKEAYDRFGGDDLRQRIADFKQILSTPGGRRFVIWIKEMAKLEEPLFGHDCNAHQLAYRTGMHDIVALMLKAMRQHEPELILKAETERSRLEQDRRTEIERLMKIELNEE